MDRRFASILAVIVIIFVGIFIVSQHSSDNSNNQTNKNKAQPTNHVTGAGKKNVTLVEYGDYECPICELYYQPVKQVVAQFQSDIYFQFRNLPLVSVHPNAFAAARAAEAAGLQGKYWQMHDMLYENQSNWASSTTPLTDFSTYATSIGLNVDQFKKDYASSQVNNAINADLAAFNKTAQQMATPTFFLDGRYLPNSDVATSSGPSVDKFAAVINAEITKKNSNSH